MKMTKLCQRILLGLIMLAAPITGLGPVGSAAEGTRFLVSYGGTAGYQLPLWVNKEFGFSKKYGVDLEIILIQAGSPNIQALVGGSLQLTQTAASSSVIAAARGAPQGSGQAGPAGRGCRAGRIGGLRRWLSRLRPSMRGGVPRTI